MQILSKKVLHIYRYESPPGVHNKYYKALSREIRTVCSNGPKHNPYNCGTFWSAPEWITHSSKLLVHSDTLLPRIFSMESFIGTAAQA